MVLYAQLHISKQVIVANFGALPVRKIHGFIFFLYIVELLLIPMSPHSAVVRCASHRKHSSLKKNSENLEL